MPFSRIGHGHGHDHDRVTAAALAGTGAIFVAVGGPDAWTSGAYTAIGVLAIVVSGALVLLKQVDKAWLERKRTWEEFHKSSLVGELAESNESMRRMRVSLHELRDMANGFNIENHSLHDDLATMRRDFLAMATNLRLAEQELHSANLSLQQALASIHATDDRLRECEDDRRILAARVEAMLVDIETNRVAIVRIEDSGERPKLPPA